MGKIQKKSGKKAIRMFFRTVLWQACVQYFDTGRACPPKKIKGFFVKTVNCQVVCMETLDLQRLLFLFYRKNHLVIVLMVHIQFVI